jgi:hypothetical protein
MPAAVIKIAVPDSRFKLHSSNKFNALLVRTASGVVGWELAIGDAGPSSNGPDDSVTSTGSCGKHSYGQHARLPMWVSR